MQVVASFLDLCHIGFFFSFTLQCKARHFTHDSALHYATAFGSWPEQSINASLLTSADATKPGKYDIVVMILQMAIPLILLPLAYE